MLYKVYDLNSIVLIKYVLSLKSLISEHTLCKLINCEIYTRKKHVSNVVAQMRIHMGKLLLSFLN